MLPWNPVEALREAIRRVPALKYALAVVGVAAAGAIIRQYFESDIKGAVVLLLIVFVGMILLFIFAGLVTTGLRNNQLAGQFLIWGILLLFFLLLGASVSAAFVGYPCNWARFIRVEVNRSCPLTSAAEIAGNGHTATDAGSSTSAGSPSDAESTNNAGSPSKTVGWFTVIGNFMTTTGRSKPEALAIETSQKFREANHKADVQIYRASAKGIERNFIIVPASSKKDAKDVASLAESLALNTGIFSIPNPGWQKVADCNETKCTWSVPN